MRCSEALGSTSDHRFEAGSGDGIQATTPVARRREDHLPRHSDGFAGHDQRDLRIAGAVSRGDLTVNQLTEPYAARWEVQSDLSARIFFSPHHTPISPISILMCGAVAARLRAIATDLHIAPAAGAVLAGVEE